MNELTAENLSLEELAERMQDHQEPAVRIFARRVLKALDDEELLEFIE